MYPDHILCSYIDFLYSMYHFKVLFVCLTIFLHLECKHHEDFFFPQVRNKGNFHSLIREWRFLNLGSRADAVPERQWLRLFYRDLFRGEGAVFWERDGAQLCCSHPDAASAPPPWLPAAQRCHLELRCRAQFFGPLSSSWGVASVISHLELWSEEPGSRLVLAASHEQVILNSFTCNWSPVTWLTYSSKDKSGKF